jgi:hypothetical protein
MGPTAQLRGTNRYVAWGAPRTRRSFFLCSRPPNLGRSLDFIGPDTVCVAHEPGVAEPVDLTAPALALDVAPNDAVCGVDWPAGDELDRQAK